ncbi:MAG: hypothetical protein WD425_07615 [Nitrospirales bacterium]
MATLTREDQRTIQPAAVRRISWAAIFAGVIIVLVVQLSLSLLGIGIGTSTIDPLEGESPTASNFSIGAAIWWILASVIALIAGGWVAGRLAGMPQQTDGLLHGLITWGAATLLTVYFLTTSVGSILGGTFGVIGSALSATGQGLSGFAPMITDTVTSQFQKTDMTWEDIKQEAQTLLRQTGKEDLQPESLRNTAENTGEKIKESARQAATAPQQTDTELLTMLERLTRKGKDVASEVDREAVVNVLVARTQMSRPEAERTVERWTATYENAMAQYDKLKGQAGQQAREVADSTAEAVSEAAIWTFLAMVLGAAAAAAGGAIGAPRDLIALRPEVV